MKYSAIITNGHISCNTAVLPGSPDLAIPQAKAMGFDGVQLTIGTPEDYDIPALKKLCSEHDIDVTGLATGRVYTVFHCSMGSDDEKNRQESVHRLKELADVCHELNHASLVIGACRGKTSDASTPEVYHRQFEKSLREICSYCEPLEVPVILELIDYLESDCCNRIPELLNYLDRINSPVLKMYMDTMHLYYEKEDIPAVLRKFGSSIPQLDISGEDRLPPTESVIQFDDALTALKDSGFDGVLTFEMDSRGDVEVAKTSLRYIKELFS